jgi:hypothetical protein
MPLDHVDGVLAEAGDAFAAPKKPMIVKARIRAMATRTGLRALPFRWSLSLQDRSPVVYRS